jgi:hypothetical protein
MAAEQKHEGSGYTPISRVTIAAFEDMGYVVNYAAADEYHLPSGKTPSKR